MEKPFDSRLSSFKNRGALKPEEIRRRREDVTVEIRKQKREESLAKRRNFQAPLYDFVWLFSGSDSDEEQDIQPTGAFQEQLPEMIQGVMSPDPEVQLAAVGRFRKILSKGKDIWRFYWLLTG